MAPKFRGQPAPDVRPEVSITMNDILDNWFVAEGDLHAFFGIDCESGVLHERSWRWLAGRLIYLVDRPGTQLGAAVRQPR